MTTELEDYEAFVRDATPRLLRYAYVLSGDAQLAQDLVQEALLAMYQHWARLDMARNPVAYAHQTVHNLHVNRVERRSSSEVPTDSPLEGGWAEAPEEQVQLKLEVARVLAILPPKERAVLVARYLNDMTVADTAAALGASEAWVRTTSYRALSRLRAVEAAPTRAPRGRPEEVAF